MQALDIGRAFTFGFEDEQWLTKLLIGALLLLLGFVFSFILIGVVAFFIISGYAIATARNVSRDEELPLPTWEDFSGMLVDGFRLLAATFVWSIPMFILYTPIAVLTIMADQNNGGVWAALLTITLLTCGCLALIYGIFLFIISPILMWLIAAEERIGAALDVRRVIDILRSHLGPVVVVAIAIWVAQLLASLVGALLCGVGLLATSVWAVWVQGHLVGQLGRLVTAPGVSGPYPAEAVG